MSDCIYGKTINKGLEHYIICSKSGSYCKYQKYCNKRKEAINTNNYLECSFLKEEEHNMAKTNSVKKNKESLEEKEVSVTNKLKKNVVSKEEHIAYYTVLIATPSSYVLDINGCPTKIYEQNDYKSGETISYKG